MFCSSTATSAPARPRSPRGSPPASASSAPSKVPTFTLVNEYDGPVRLYHLDLYRLSGADDITGLGYEEYLEPSDGITVVEWPERAGSMLPETYLLVTLVAGAGIRHRLIFDPVGDDEAASRWNRALTSDCKG
jgi:tRNA A37 threonylcarbamoyladenosine biosynthesis protein TsaE